MKNSSTKAICWVVITHLGQLLDLNLIFPRKAARWEKQVYLQLIAFRSQISPLIIFSWIFHDVYSSFHSLLRRAQNGEYFPPTNWPISFWRAVSEKGLNLNETESLFNEGRLARTSESVNFWHSNRKENFGLILCDCHANCEGKQRDKDLNRIIVWQSS